jgi:hypothetical protein
MVICARSCGVVMITTRHKQSRREMNVWREESMELVEETSDNSSKQVM